MILRNLASFVLSVFLLYIATSKASDEARYYAMHDELCSKYLMDRKSSATTLPHVAWVAGYLTAYNRQTPDTYNIAPVKNASELIPWIDRWCKANAASSLGRAMEALTDELNNKRQKTRPRS